MTKRSLFSCAVAMGLALGLAAPGDARVTRIEITERTPYTSEGYSGAYGPYETLRGQVYYEVDPDSSLHRGIVDLDRAPRNADGRVEFSGAIEILKPIDMGRGRRRLFYIVPNRGGDNNTFNDLLANRGFAVILSGWQGNIGRDQDRPFWTDFPIAKSSDGSEITGKVYNTFYLTGTTSAASRALTDDRGFAYRMIESVSTDNSGPGVKLTVREYWFEPRVEIPKDKWAFATANPDGSKGTPSTSSIWLEGGFQPGLMYELVYVGKNPIVNGLGWASVRDLMSFLRYERTGNPLAVSGGIVAAYGYGKSQSGRFLRTMLNEGFNEDESSRQVFDGIIPDAPGGSQGFFNFRFSNPGRVSSPDADLFQLSDYPPFSFSVTRDPYTGVVGSLLDKARRSRTLPKVFMIQTSSEYWTRTGSLAHLAPDLRYDQVFPPNVRYYHISSSQHTPNTSSTTNATRQLPSNPANHGHVIHALIVAMDEWVTQGIEPPPNTLPRLRDRTIGDWMREGSGFPDIPGVNYPGWPHEPPIFDLSTIVDGVLTEVPIPVLGFYPAYTPKVDADGNEIAGIRIPDIECPIGTHTGWALRSGINNGEGTPIRNAGGFIPFARTRAERLATGDPRLSLEERYPDHEAYVKCVEDSARKAARQRFILPEAVEDYVQRAQARQVP